MTSRFVQSILSAVVVGAVQLVPLAANAVPTTSATANVTLLNVTAGPPPVRTDFDSTNGGAGFTSASTSGSLSFAQGSARAQLFPTTASGPPFQAPTLTLKAEAHGQSTLAGDGCCAGASADVFTDEIVFTTPAGSAGQTFAVGFDYHLQGTLGYTGGGSAGVQLRVGFASPDLSSEALDSFSRYTNCAGCVGNTGTVNDVVTGFTSYGGPVVLAGAATAVDWHFTLDVELSTSAVGAQCSGCGLPEYGSADSSFSSTFEGQLVYDPRLTLSLPAANPVPEPGSLATMLAGLSLLGAIACRRRGSRAAP